MIPGIEKCLLFIVKKNFIKLNNAEKMNICLIGADKIQILNITIIDPLFSSLNYIKSTNFILTFKDFKI